MNNFTIIKRGYSQLEVDNYISRLKNDYETKLSEQKDRIFYLKDQLDKITNSSDNELMTSLVSAVEHAKLIENSSRNIYELETKRLQLLYSRMEEKLDSSGPENYSRLKRDLLTLIEDCKKSLNHNLTMQKQNLSAINTEDPVRRLLSKMIMMKKAEKEPSEDAPKKEVFKEEKPKNQKQEKPQQPQPKKVEKTNEFSEFLKDDVEEVGNNFENIMFKNNDKKPKSVITADLYYPTPNESGFDLKEAVNPKDDLEEIMKAFDFYNDD